MGDFEGFIFKPLSASDKSITNATSNEQSIDQIGSTSANTSEFVVDWQALSQRFNHVMTTNESDQRQAERQDQFRTFHSPLEARSRADTQAARRSQALALQKKNRSDRTAQARCLALDGASDEDNSKEWAEDKQVSLTAALKRNRDSDDEMMEGGKLFRTEVFENEKIKKSREKKAMKYANQLMYAETMEDIPQDLMTSWSMLICPVGKRCLVTSGNGQTLARKRNGRVMKCFQSVLPGGSRSSRSRDTYCVLDCVYDAKHWTFYVLDIMCWKGYSIYDCETDFRHFWLQTRLDATEMDVATSDNRYYRIQPLKPIPANELGQVLPSPSGYAAQQGLNYEVDGLLFYLREAQYVIGSTPLACWVPLDELQSRFCNK
ncbi:hypothetical protein DFQ28_008979 [Apophysomyces sp. BC1034]|nr:hypothetical protein DFQ28_008979 [Apophysomyces sp. BC1034]